jgi:hypothetical protein
MHPQYEYCQLQQVLQLRSTTTAKNQLNDASTVSH